MSYSKSKKCVRLIEPILKQLISAKGRISLPNRNPSRLGYKLREAIYASQFYEDTKHFANLNTKFIFQLKGQSIDCVIREIVGEEFVSQIAMDDLRSEIVIPDVENLMGVIGAVIKHKAEHFLFPSFIMSDDSTEALDKFCKQYGYEYIIDENGLELKKC
jgi:hypothetical protein